MNRNLNKRWISRKNEPRFAHRKARTMLKNSASQWRAMNGTSNINRFESWSGANSIQILGADGF
jgi:hypothetical protein